MREEDYIAEMNNKTLYFELDAETLGNETLMAKLSPYRFYEVVIEATWTGEIWVCDITEVFNDEKEIRLTEEEHNYLLEVLDEQIGENL